MGNCCECTSSKSSENSAEIYIRESILMLKIRNLSYNEFLNMNSKEYDMFISEILNKKKTKYNLNENQYENLVSNVFMEKINCKDLTNKQKLSCLPFQENYMDDLGINYILSLWVLAHFKFEIDSKIEFIFKILKDTEKFVNVKIFQKFLIRYLRVNLNMITKNFNKSNDIVNNINKSKDLKILNKLFSTILLEKYLNKILEGLKLTLKLNNENLASSDIDNEFLNEKIIENFFKNNLYLLDIISLRESAYAFTRSITDYSYTE